ncbi:MAG: type II toxin-antitoxin system PemK/MazF family toxin [Chloroflexi bacterium]|nr:type II toxin-antitoxin system PemK/MazF family toxin [Chloroflexota bacterium]
MRRGEVWWANLPSPWGRRPVVLLTRESGYDFLTWIMAAPLTTTRRLNPAAVPLDPRADGVPQPSLINLDAIQVVRIT